MNSKLEEMTARNNKFLFIIIGYAVIYGVLELLAHLTVDVIKTENALIVMAGVLVCTAIVETVMFRNGLADLVKLLGLSKPTTSSIIAALIITAVLFACYPLITLITGFKFTIPENWLWLAVGVFALHGIAEEVLYRGYLFRRLRIKRTFWRAAWFAVLLFSIAHIPIIINQGVFVGGMAVLLSVVSSFPFAWMYEKGGNTIWAPAIVHFAIDTVIPILALGGGMGEGSQIAVMLWMLAAMIVPYLAFLLLRKPLNS